MKTLFASFALFVGLALPASAQTSLAVLLGWTGSGNTGATCPATTPTSCLNGYVAKQGATVVGTPSLTSTSLQFPAPAPGTYVYTLAVTGFDALGNAITGPTASTTVVVPASFSIPNAPVGLKGSIVTQTSLMTVPALGVLKPAVTAIATPPYRPMGIISSDGRQDTPGWVVVPSTEKAIGLGATSISSLHATLVEVK